MRYEDFKILMEIVKRIGNSKSLILALKGGDSYICADYEEVTRRTPFSDLNENEKKYLLDNMLVYNKEDLSEVDFEVKENIEGTEVVLSVHFYELNERYSSKVTFDIYGKRSFRKASKKEAYNKLYNEVEKYAENTAKELNEYKREYEETLRLFDRIRKTIAILNGMGYTDEQIIEAADLYLEYLNTDNKEQFLKDNGFKGTENLGVYERKPDGFGHEIVRYADISFLKKEIDVRVGCSCD